ncbi:MAG: aminotransferase class I/II-fold pyridoxal phosphate-dependent enzyme [Saprospiraceae bacterium]|nr:aminotransferase class I/II-fold pyridoxal phosphate-dependent enzyme [Saprospiraceae bacterium]
MESKFNHIESLCASEPKLTNSTQAHKNPIVASSTFKFNTIDEGVEIFKSQPGHHVYTRYGNPGIESVAQKIADLESFGLGFSSFGLLTSSGMAALFTAISANCKENTLLVSQGNLYGGTTELLQKIIAGKGVSICLTDLSDLAETENLFKTKSYSNAILLIETPSNPTLQCLDLEALCALARQYGAMVVVDNTFATPILQQPLAFGADIVVHSTTKYIHGHGLSTGGALVFRDENLFKKAWEIMKLVGCNCNPYDAWLINTGMKTLALRINQQSNNALFLAEQLSDHPQISSVNYPGLKSHPSNKIASKQMRSFGAMVSFSVGKTLSDAKSFCNHLKYCSIAPSLGETDSMILHPATMSHLKVDSETRKYYGITDNLIRLSVGLEHPQDILDDIDQALKFI